MYLSSSRSADLASGRPDTRSKTPPEPLPTPGSDATTDTASGTAPDTGSGTKSGAASARRSRRVAPVVVTLGVVSLVTDVSAEMVTAVLPVYLVLGLGLSPLAFGMLDGLYNGATAASRLLGGHVADRFRRHKTVAAVGYGISAGCKLLLPAAGGVSAIGGVLAADRAGKGLRTAPRDALISMAATPEGQGRAFGVHRAMDTAGALFGPPVALAVLWVTADAYDAVFVVSFCLAAFGVLVLLLFVRDPAREGTRGGTGPVVPREPVRLRDAAAVLRVPGFTRVCVAALVLGAATVGDAMLYLLLQRHTDLSPHLFPLLPLGTALVFLLLAVTAGTTGDRYGRGRVFLVGHVALLGGYLVLLTPLSNAALIIAIPALLGVFYACTDGVLMALAAPAAPARLRGGALALVQTGQAGGRAVGAAGFGAAWTLYGPYAATVVAAIGLVVALVVAAALLAGGRLAPGAPRGGTPERGTP
ncbi:MFS transporter [Embleya sp. NBC_00896]|uniref:MFS transporter n=1 Tax=Embleya sp. NBC_00896 TaxID=2975961 RepID=UPI003866E9FD|nr:MFS transporter [Embleya sp. NBC_00896]